MDLTDRARRYVDRMPAAVSGSGGHNATFHVACVLVQGFGMTPEQAFPLLADFNQRCTPPWSEKELRHKLRGADRSASTRGRGFLAKGAEWTPSKEWKGRHSIPERVVPGFDEEKLSKFSGEWARRVDLVWLANRSALDPATVTAGAFLGHVFREGEKAVVFTNDKGSRFGDGLELWPGSEPPASAREGVWFLSQPVDGEYHATDVEGKVSCRNFRAVTAWRYLVIESDEADTRKWLGAVAQLPLRLTALYSSGGRSVHALVRLDARTKGEWDEEVGKLKAPLAVLGADIKTMTAVRLTRLPGCLREGKRYEEVLPDGGKVKRYQKFPRPILQKLLYLNPNPPLAPLVDLFPRRDVVAEWCDRAAAGIADSDPTGGEWIIRGLQYYATVSGECDAELRGLTGAES